jgi:hypothetical protein
MRLWKFGFRYERQGNLVTCPKRLGITVAELVALQASLDCGAFFRSPSVYVGLLAKERTRNHLRVVKSGSGRHSRGSYSAGR